jgi:hypothetical protein
MQIIEEAEAHCKELLSNVARFYGRGEGICATFGFTNYDGVNIGIVTDELPRNRGAVWNSDRSNSEALTLRMPKDGENRTLSIPCGRLCHK